MTRLPTAPETLTVRLKAAASGWLIALLLSYFPSALYAKDAATPAEETLPAAAKKSPEAALASKTLAEKVREATENGNLAQKRMTLIVNGKGGKSSPAPTPVASNARPIAEKIIDLDVTVRAPAPAKRPPVAQSPSRVRHTAAVKAATPAHPEKQQGTPEAHAQTEGHWSYAGDTGPQAWGRLSKDFNVCAIGKRQSPINIEEASTLQGPAEPLQFNYQPSKGTVVNNGHTIQVDLAGEAGTNDLTVRGSRFKLMQFHFHTPSEEQVNGVGFAMVAHLLHKNEAGQLAVVAVLLEPGTANSLIHQVWTYMPLDSGDRVSIPAGLIDLNALLPKDQRYYQFMGSLTTPPCTEGVLWMVMKQPTPISKEQIKLFTQIFPNNARPVQAVNGRSVRDAQ
jgi:carbonic anhydrase